MSDASPREGKTAHKAGAFDIRTFIAMLIGLYGVILVVTGLFFTSDSDLAKADGLNINVWTGVALVIVAAMFQIWAMRKPVVVPDDFEAEE